MRNGNGCPCLLLLRDILGREKLRWQASDPVDSQTSEMKRFREILFVAELGQKDRAALEQAVVLAERNGGRITVAGVVPRLKAAALLSADGPTSTVLQEAFTSKRRETLAEFIEPFKDRVEFQVVVLMGTAFIEIVRQVLHGGHDLVVKAPRDIDWLDRMLGSDDMHLLRKCPCPVWMHKQASARPYGKVLAAINVDEIDPDSRQGEQWEMGRLLLELASSLAESMRADLHVAHVWEVPGEIVFRQKLVGVSEAEIAEYRAFVEHRRRKTIEGLLASVGNITRLNGDEPYAPTVHFVKGNPARDLANIADDLQADLILMGTLGRSGTPGLFISSTAEMVLEQISCSVLAVKPPGFRTPVELAD